MTTSDYLGYTTELTGSNREAALREAVTLWGYRVGRNGHHFTQDEVHKWVTSTADALLEWLEKD